MKKFLYYNLLIFFVVILAAFTIGLFTHEHFRIFQAQAADEDEDETPPLITNVKISDISATSSIITWNTDEEADSLINYGLDKSYGIIRDPRYDKTEHKIIVEGLEPNRTYYFRITSSDDEGNQGISSDYSFKTEPVEEEETPTFPMEKIIEEGKGGLSKEGLEVLQEMIKQVATEDQLEIIEEQVIEQAQQVVEPPTIILDNADVEVGIDYAIISWETDKEANSMVALAHEDEYNPYNDDPYTWKEGEPDEYVKEHVVEVNGLLPATVYHFQVSSQSSLGLTGKSGDKTFKTKSILPEIANIRLSKIQEDSATVQWTTNVPCSSVLEYTNLNNNETKLEGNSSFLTIHKIQLTGLIFDTYYSVVINVESEEGEEAQSEPLTFITIRDEEPPVISKVNTESTIYPGSDNKIQTIASWESDEPSRCQLFYHQGLITVDEPLNLPLEDDFATKHVQVITNFIPSTVYKFWIVCTDEADNTARSEDFTMLTPTQEESIIDIIIKNFESSFGWLKKLKL